MKHLVLPVLLAAITISHAGERDLDQVKAMVEYKESLKMLARQDGFNSSVQSALGSRLERPDLLFEILWEFQSSQNAEIGDWADRALLALAKDDLDLSNLQNKAEFINEFDKFLSRKYFSETSERRRLGAAILIKQRPSSLAEAIIEVERIPDLDDLKEMVQQLESKEGP